MYQLSHFGSMIRDQVRMDAFAHALQKAVRPGDIVVDIGAGTGIFALLACQYGARHVYAIEPNTVYEIGRQMAVDNDCADRITFIEQLSQHVDLPERADIIVGDIRGQTPIFEHIIPTYADARRRFLKPGGIVIPQQDFLFAGLVAHPDLYRARIIEPWQENRYSLNMQAAVPVLTSSIVPASLKAEHLVEPPQQWTTLDYTTCEDPRLSGTAAWIIQEAHTVEFIALWFDTDLYAGIGYSNRPGANGAVIYGQTLLPFPQPLSLQAGDAVEIGLQSYMLGMDYHLFWQTSVRGADGKKRVRHEQTTLFSKPYTALLKQGKASPENLNPQGQITRFALNAFVQGLSFERIAEEIYRQYSGQFETLDAALAYLRRIAENYQESPQY